MGLETIEAAIINKIKTSVPDFAIVKGYQGEFERPEVLKLPAALVIYGKGKYKRANRILDKTGHWTVMVAAHGMKGTPKRTHNIYRLLDLLTEALWDFSPADGVGAMELADDDSLISSQTIIVFAQDYIIKERLSF